MNILEDVWRINIELEHSLWDRDPYHIINFRYMFSFLLTKGTRNDNGFIDDTHKMNNMIAFYSQALSATIKTSTHSAHTLKTYHIVFMLESEILPFNIINITKKIFKFYFLLFFFLCRNCQRVLLLFSFKKWNVNRIMTIYFPIYISVCISFINFLKALQVFFYFKYCESFDKHWK